MGEFPTPRGVKDVKLPFFRDVAAAASGEQFGRTVRRSSLGTLRGNLIPRKTELWPICLSDELSSARVPGPLAREVLQSARAGSFLPEGDRAAPQSQFRFPLEFLVYGTFVPFWPRRIRHRKTRPSPQSVLFADRQLEGRGLKSMEGVPHYLFPLKLPKKLP